MKSINKAIIEHIISAVIFTIFLVAVAIVLTSKFIESNIQKVYSDNGFMIQINPKINKELEELSDIEGLSSKSNIINITNNNNSEKKYQIFLTPVNDNDDDIRISLGNSLIRSLSKYEKKDGSYFLGEYSLPVNQTRIHSIRIWKDKKDHNKKINVNFNLEVKTLN